MQWCSSIATLKKIWCSNCIVENYIRPSGTQALVLFFTANDSEVYQRFHPTAVIASDLNAKPWSWGKAYSGGPGAAGITEWLWSHILKRLRSLLQPTCSYVKTGAQFSNPANDKLYIRELIWFQMQRRKAQKLSRISQRAREPHPLLVGAERRFFKQPATRKNIADVVCFE